MPLPGSGSPLHGALSSPPQRTNLPVAPTRLCCIPSYGLPWAAGSSAANFGDQFNPSTDASCVKVRRLCHGPRTISHISIGVQAPAARLSERFGRSGRVEAGHFWDRVGGWDELSGLDRLLAVVQSLRPGRKYGPGDVIVTPCNAESHVANLLHPHGLCLDATMPCTSGQSCSRTSGTRIPTPPGAIRVMLRQYPSLLLSRSFRGTAKCGMTITTQAWGARLGTRSRCRPD